MGGALWFVVVFFVAVVAFNLTMLGIKYIDYCLQIT